jgi:peptidoglycan/LPS O-acetylase OafA/YrhL
MPFSEQIGASRAPSAARSDQHGMKRFQSIQIMRGIAASMVVLYHFGYSNDNFLAAFPASARFSNTATLAFGCFLSSPVSSFPMQCIRQVTG